VRFFTRRGLRKTERRHSATCRRPLRLERLEDRTVPAVTILNSPGAAGLNLNQSNDGNGNYYVPPDTNGAAGPAAYVERVNAAIELFPTKGSSANGLIDGASHFFFTTGGLSRADSGSGDGDSGGVVYDELIHRFIVGYEDTDTSTHVSAFDIAVSRSSNPTTLSAADWAFYKIDTTESGYNVDYPGNTGYNADAFVVTLNIGGHVEVISVKAADLANAVASPQVVKTDLSGSFIRPTTMHGSVPGDPMWLVTAHGDSKSIDVIKMTGELTSSPTFANTNLAVTPYSGVVAPLNPDGTTITTNIGSWIQKAAEANGTLVAAQAVSVSATQDVVQWYAINVGSGSPSLVQQGRVGGGNNTYAVYPGIDINPAGQIGMSYMQSGTDTATDYESMWVAVRVPADAAGTMEPSVLVPAGTGTQDNADGRAGDLSGINVDPVDGSFWAVNETANAVEPASPYGPTINWGTTIANFNPGIPAGETDVAVTASGPSALSAGDTVTYTITLTNNGPLAAQGVVLTDTLPAGATLVSFNQTAGTDGFTFGQSGGTVTQTANGPLAAGSSDTFSLVVTADPNTAPGANFSDAASVAGSTYDYNPTNNSAGVAGGVFGPPADLVVTTSTPTAVTEGNSITYTVTVTNNGPNPATGVVLTDIHSGMRTISVTVSQGTLTLLGGKYSVDIGSIDAGASVTLTATVQAVEDTGLVQSPTVTATSADPNSSNNSLSVSIAGSEPPIVVSGPIKTTAKSLSNFTVATFTHANGIEGTGAFSATINWGDGTTSAGTITLSGTTYSVVGSHTYKGGNSKTITTAVTEVGNAGALQGVNGGDDGVNLPPYLGGDPGWQRSLNAQTNQATHLVSDYLAGKATLQDVTSSLTALFARAKSEDLTPDLSGLYELLRSAEATNPRALDVLLLLDDLWAEFGG
jgi:uncharacterized repeat protein (TIGR01451 family)